ncbi:TonB family protein [bacterium]|nr:TonB family protein [bacterium]
MEQRSELAAPPRTWIGRRSAVTTALSGALHLAALLALATATLRIADPERDIIPLIIREPAPLPLPGAPSAPTLGEPAANVAPVEPPQPQPAVIPRPAPRAQPAAPAPKPKIAARPKPAAKPAPPPPPAAEPAAAAPVAAAPELGSGVGGAMGVAGGAPGGRHGGRLGGHGDDVFRPDQVAVAPSVLSVVQPVYPAIARARGQQGVVVVQAIIDRSGDIEGDSLRVLQSQPPFDDAALAAFRRWRFRPGRDDHGSAVRVIVQQPIRFQLR